MGRIFALSGVLLMLVGAPASAQTGMLAGLVRDPLALQVEVGGGKAVLEALATRPDRPGRFPLVVMVHGTPRSTGTDFAATLAAVSPALFNNAAAAFSQRGYAAVTILRRGFGRSDGPYREFAGPCVNPDHLRAARLSAEDVVAAVASLRAMPWADPDHVLSLGMSTGGMAVSAAAALNPQGVVGVIDFAGGRGSFAPDQVCAPDRLVGAFGALGATARVPALWMYAENDHFFSPALAPRMFDAYAGAGAPAQLHIMPAFGADGHNLAVLAPAQAWWPVVAPFLASLGLPTRVVVELPPVASLPSPPFLRSETCRGSFANYVAARTEAKAFAISVRGGCGWTFTARSAEDAKEAALRNCARAGTDCTLYAVGRVLAH
jgi:dienelactone hydrolase